MLNYFDVNYKLLPQVPVDNESDLSSDDPITTIRFVKKFKWKKAGCYAGHVKTEKGWEVIIITGESPREQPNKTKQKKWAKYRIKKAKERVRQRRLSNGK